jgi:thioredoxin reductase
MSPELPIVIIGAGPVGLAGAAHAVSRGLEPLVLEAGPAVGASMREWGHVRLFSPWRYNVDQAAARLLEQVGWSHPPADALPTGGDLVQDYLEPLARVPSLAGRIRPRSRVVAIGRVGVDKVKTPGRSQAPFLVRIRRADGTHEDIRARAVIDASGTWSSPNPLGATGLRLEGEERHAERIRHGIPDILGAERARYAHKTTLVVGSGHSAANSILALAELSRATEKTRIVWGVRRATLANVFGGGEADGLPARGRLGAELQALVHAGALRVVTGWQIDEVTTDNHRLRVTGARAEGPFRLDGVDEIIVATGQRPDLTINRELRLSLDPALESTSALGPLIDPNEHSCGTVRPHGHAELAHPEPGFYIVGSKSYGRAPTFLMATGYEQVRSVVAAIAGDLEAANRVELDLPETGVCSTRLASASDASAACCGAPPAKAASPGKRACC